MKKSILMLMLALMLAVAVTACADSVGSALEFTQRNFYGGQTLAVYRGPGVEYGRGSNGWAKASTDEALYAAGKENGWALVMYPTGEGTTRVGWVDLSQFKYNVSRLKLKEICFEYRQAKITSDCILTDDPVLASRDLCLMQSGATVTYLGSFYKYRSWAYIETWLEGRPIRAFVPMDCISVN